MAKRLVALVREQEGSQARKLLRRSWVSISILLSVITFVLAWFFLKPTMPSQIELLTGAESSAYYELGVRYAEDLRSRGLDAKVVVTGGALDNAQRLATNANAIGFAPSLTPWEGALGEQSSELVGLASIGLEPIWLFHRSDFKVDRLPDLAGMTIATEGDGTTSDHIARRLIARNGLQDDLTLTAFEGLTAQQLVQEFQSGSIDAVALSGTSTSPLIRVMLENDGLSLMSLERATAYATLMPGVTAVEAPEGVFSLARNIPSSDAKMLANTTCLIANEHVPPAVVPMILVAADNVRHQNRHFTAEDSFPTKDHLTLPIAWSAERFFRQGEVGLSKYLPYKVTRFLNQLGFLVLPVLTVALLMLKLIPMGLKSWGKMHLRRQFRVLESVEKKRCAGEPQAELLSELEEIDTATATMFVPRGLTHDYVDFRQFLHDLRERVLSGAQ
ncbi:MAG: TAXI family TRAP transporter solute-binding subunit [Rubripirellula sp.]